VHQEVTIPELTEVVARVAALLGPREGAVSLLDGGITNRNFRVRFGGSDYVVRLPGKDTALLGIDRGAECAANKQAADLGIAPPVAAYIEEPPCLVTVYVAGRPMGAVELREPDTIAEVARALRSFHDSDLELSSNFDCFRVVERYAAVAGERGAEMPGGLDEALDRAGAIRDAMGGGRERAPAPCHGDLLDTNFLWDGDRVLIVDWEYAGMGERYFDLANFAVNNGLEDEEETLLLREYLGDPPTDRQRAEVKLLRYMSDLRETAWAVVQSAVSEIRFDFGGYARKHLERLTATAEDPRFEGWLRDARAGP
jgi:thiamine kinase-like enzyme